MAFLRSFAYGANIIFRQIEKTMSERERHKSCIDCYLGKRHSALHWQADLQSAVPTSQKSPLSSLGENHVICPISSSHSPLNQMSHFYSPFFSTSQAHSSPKQSNSEPAISSLVSFIRTECTENYSAMKNHGVSEPHIEDYRSNQILPSLSIDALKIPLSFDG